MIRRTLIGNLLAAVAILAAGKLLFAIQDVIIKELSGAYPVHQVMAIRGLAAIPILLAIMLLRARLGDLRHHHPGLHLVRGTLMLLAFTCFYVALAGTSLTTATALFFTAPFFITLLSVPLLGEVVGLRRITGIAVGFIGVLVVLRPQTDDFNYYDLLPILAALLYAAASSWCACSA